jgi:3'-5' exoribonuclease
MVEDRIRQIPDFPAELSMLIKHLLLSHHGQYDFGSPKRPKFLEAVILNFIDDLDSKINGVQTHIDKEPNKEGNWTNYHRLYDRYFYKGSALVKPKKNEPAAPGKSKPPVTEKQPDRIQRKSYNKPLGTNLGDQLREKNLDLFSAMTEKGGKS